MSAHLEPLPVGSVSQKAIVATASLPESTKAIARQRARALAVKHNALVDEARLLCQRRARIAR